MYVLYYYYPSPKICQLKMSDAKGKNPGTAFDRREKDIEQKVPVIRTQKPSDA